MSENTVPTPPILSVLSGPSPRTIEDVLALMAGIDASLLPADGLKWFNYLYWKTTKAIKVGPSPGGWEDTPGLLQLDVVFASYYFQAVRDWYQAQDHVSRSWRPLLANRARPDVLRIQFALTGMNAHINHDLPMALVETCRQRETPLIAESALYRDYVRVNDILETVELEAKQELATGLAGLAAEQIGAPGDMAAMWSIRAARETAWDNAMVLWSLNDVPLLRSSFLLSLDRLVGLAGHAFMLPAAIG